MRLIITLILALSLLAAHAAPAASLDDVATARSCRYCGMDRGEFSHSRMLIEYADGSVTGTCSLRCVAVELANAIDKMPVAIKVGAYDSRELIDAERAVWVIGGNRKGVMTGTAKWAFATREAADAFVKADGGKIATFDDAIRSAYEDMYRDTRMIRERRMKRMKMSSPPAPQAK